MRQVVYKNDGSIPVDDILCTTYQMRNFYHQLRDGFFSNLDVMNYIQHLAAVRMMKKGDRVLDVCCGRGLLLPMMRYHSKDIGEYIGVDIEEKNIESRTRNICNGKPIDPAEHFPFKTTWVISDVAEMSAKVEGQVDLIVYTSAIEHMHKDRGAASITECSKMARKGATLFLSCPNTPEGKDGFDVQYKAHVYEWKLSELRELVAANGFEVEEEVGLVGGVRDFKGVMDRMPQAMKAYFEKIVDYLPTEFLTPLLYIPLPGLAKEVLLICRRS
jgi:2-polyprenyl-3-methyl-5-hydroxy-6-metoxy-1,4-benzoquinol methylase